MQLATAGKNAQLFVDDVFAAYTRVGTGASKVVTTGIDMSQGYLLWSKGRSGATDHALYDSARGVTKDLVCNTTAAETTQAQGLTAVSATGHTVDTLAKVNTSAATYVDWVFRNAPKFFTHQTLAHTSGVADTIDLSVLGIVGMVVLKRIDGISDWVTWHRSGTTGKLVYFNTTVAETTDATLSVSGATLTVAAALATGSYIVYAWAHDASADGLIQCGSFTTDAGGNANVALGWEPQFLLYRQLIVSNWRFLDQSRAWPNIASKAAHIFQTAAAEGLGNWGAPNVNGFTIAAMTASTSSVYLAIRRPNKPPTAGADVYNAIARTGTGAAATVSGLGFAPDLVAFHRRSGTSGGRWSDRLRGAGQELVPETSAAETAVAQGLTAFSMDGFSLGTDAVWNVNTATCIQHCFKRAPGFFDIVCYTGTGAAHTEQHNLGVAPELLIVKSRSLASSYRSWVSSLSATEYMNLDNTSAKASDGGVFWNSTFPTASVFSLNTNASVNQAAATYVAYLFATLPGVSKVGSYTGNGSSQTIDCGFAAGARFILIKRTDAAGDWLVWDTVRGIIAGNDPHIALNATNANVAEVTTDDSIDPATSGFSVNQVAATNINVTSATYIFLAIA